MDGQINSVWRGEVRLPWICACAYVLRGTTYALRLCLYIESKSRRQGSGGRGGFGPDPLHLAFLAHHENFMLFSSSISRRLCSSQASADQRPPGQAGSKPRPGRLPSAALANSNEPSINSLVSSNLILWLLRGARARDNVQAGRKDTKSIFKVLFLVLQPRFFSKLLWLSSSHGKESHLGLQQINKPVLQYEGRAVISTPYQRHQINRTNHLASDWLAGHLFWQKERKLISRDESKVEPCC